MQTIMCRNHMAPKAYRNNDMLGFACPDFLPKLGIEGLEKQGLQVVERHRSCVK